MNRNQKRIPFKFCIVGCHYCGTTSLYQYMKEKKMDVIKDEGLFSLHNGHRKFPNYHKGRTPVIIVSKNKKELWQNNLPKWDYLNPVLVTLEEMKIKSGFPHRMGARHGESRL